MSRVKLIGFWPDYEAVTLAVDLAPEFDVQLVNLKHLLEPDGFARGLRRIWRRRAYARVLAAEIGRTTQAIYLFQDNIRLLNMLGTLRRPFFGGVLARDPGMASAVRTAKLRKLSARGVRVWSFDARDCAEQGYEPYAQFVRRQTVPTGVETASDLFFVGRDKGRRALLDALRREAEAAGCRVDFTILQGGHANVPYAGYLQRLWRSRCMVDITQTGQAGVTMRAAEALLYGRKLITNNARVYDMAGYAPERVMVIDGVPDGSTIRDFIDAPCGPVPDSIVDAYEAHAVLARVFRQAMERRSLG